MKFIITFDNVSGSIISEQALKAASYPCRLDTAPRSLGVGCVYVIRTEAPSPDEISAVLQNAGITWSKILEDKG